MGNKASGNRERRDKLPLEEKSRLLQFRLDPKKKRHKQALASAEKWIAYYVENGLPVGDFFCELIEQFEGVQANEPTVLASAGDIIDIKQLVQYVVDKIESGQLGAASGDRSSKRRKKEQEIELTDGQKLTIDRYLGRGLLGDDDDIEDT